MKYKIFVDGREGTTGLQIIERLLGHEHVQLLAIDPALRKDINERRKFLNAADIAFLCLPDAAAKEAVSLIANEHTRVIDASTAFRTDPDWTYGFPELGSTQREKIAAAKRVALPGCHATGFIAGVYPLVKGGILAADHPIACHSVTGYSGGGKNLIARYENPERYQGDSLCSPGFYALGLTHKHLPEMQKICGLSQPPVFTPIVGDFYKGMTVALPLFAKQMAKLLSAAAVRNYLADYYQNCPFVRVLPFGQDENLEYGFFHATGCNDTNRLDILVNGHEEQTVVLSRLDNLGKGSSGAAIQCMNIMLGLPEKTGLAIL